MFLSNFGKIPILCERNTGRVDRCITLKLLHVPRSCREELVGGQHSRYIPVTSNLLDPVACACP